MGKKRITTKGGDNKNNALRSRALAKGGKRKLSKGILHVESTYNNTRVSLTDELGNMFFTTSAGALGFKGAKKGTPFAASKVGELIGEQALQAGVSMVDIIVKGVGAGRDAAVRSFVSKGIELSSIKDRTPIPFNGVRNRKPRRV